MKTIILAGGYGTRLEEYGIQLPKGLIKIHGKTILSRLLDDLLTLPSHKILLVTNDRFIHMYRQFCDDYACVNLELLSDKTTNPQSRLGGVGDLLYALDRKEWWEDDLLVCPSDTPTNLTLRSFITFSNKYASNTAATIVKKTDKVMIQNRLGCAVINSNHKITTFVEKPKDPPSDLAAIPFYFYSKKSLQFIRHHRNQLKDKDGKMFDAPGNLISWLLSNKQGVFGFVIENEAIDVGTVSDIQKAQNLNI